MFKKDFSWASFGKTTGLNFMWNFADLYLEYKDTEKAIAASDFKGFGENIAKMVSDIFVKNPTDSTWRLNNSNVFMENKPPTNIITSELIFA